jgi:RimJ/RimL family protein N-acetyltransferase
MSVGLSPRRDWVKPVTLRGYGVTLRPLTETDLPALFAVTPPDTFRWYSVAPPVTSAEAFAAHMRALISDPTRLPFAVVLDEGDRVVGSTSLMDIKPEHRGLEVGFTWYTPAVRGTRVNPACKRLLLGHAIETLGAVRVQIKTDVRNRQSQAAIEKLGATYEGVLRASFIQPDGHIRDTVYYSVLPSEWPRVKAGLEARLRDPAASAG